MAMLILLIVASISIVNSLELKASQTQLPGDATPRSIPSKRFFLLPKYLLRHSKTNDNFRHTGTQPDSSLEPAAHSPLSHVKHKELTPSPSLPVLGQLPVRQGRQELQTDKVAESQLPIQPQLEDLEEHYLLADPLASENSISRPCYFSPVQCLLNIPEERINNLVDFVLPVVAVHEANQKKLAEEELANRKKVRSAENRTRLESILKAANGLFGAQMAAQNKMLDLTSDSEEDGEDQDTPQTKLTPLRTRLGGTIGPNGFGHLPSANSMNNGGQTSARSLAKMFLTQRHATSHRPYMVGTHGNQARLESRSNWMEMDN